MDFEDIVYEVENHVATIRINKPEKLNAVSVNSLQEIELAFDMAGKDPSVGVVVLTGTNRFVQEPTSRCKEMVRWGEQVLRLIHLPICKLFVAQSQ